MSAFGRIDSLEVLTQMLKKPDYQPAEDLFIAEADGNVIGYINIIPELKIGRVVLDYLVHPDFYNGSLPNDLINQAVERAQKLGVKVAHMNISPAELATEELLLNLGFTLTCRSNELRLDLRKANIDTDIKYNLQYCHFKHGEEEKLVKIQNLCFNDNWGYNPCDIEHIMWWLNFRRNCLEDVIFAYKENRMVGYCWTGINCGYNRKGEIKGRIYMMGVDPEYKNCGFGRELILKGISYIANKGRDIIDLTVNSDNDAAVALYSSVGFQKVESTLWYEKTIEPQEPE
ncbi:GNAT family N-acetyltransferase [Chloroflexota bacterium]